MTPAAFRSKQDSTEIAAALNLHPGLAWTERAPGTSSWLSVTVSSCLLSWLGTNNTTQCNGPGLQSQNGKIPVLPVSLLAIHHVG